MSTAAWFLLGACFGGLAGMLVTALCVAARDLNDGCTGNCNQGRDCTCGGFKK